MKSRARHWNPLKSPSSIRNAISQSSRNPQLAIKLIQLLSNEVGVNMDHLDRFTFKTARERLAGLLLDLGDRFGKESDDHVRVDSRSNGKKWPRWPGLRLKPPSACSASFAMRGRPHHRWKNHHLAESRPSLQNCSTLSVLTFCDTVFLTHGRRGATCKIPDVGLSHVPVLRLTVLVHVLSDPCLVPAGIGLMAYPKH